MRVPDDGAEEFVDVDLDVGLTPEDQEELVLEVGPGGQTKKIIDIVHDDDCTPSKKPRPGRTPHQEILKIKYDHF